MIDSQNIRATSSDFVDQGIASVGKFWAWWIGELHGLLPLAWRNALAARDDRLFVSFDDNQVVLGVWAGEELGDLTGYTGDGSDLETFVVEYCTRNQLDPDTAVLVLSRRQAMIKDLSLPAAVEENLDGMLNLDMDRHTPFKADDVFYTQRVVTRDREKARIAVELVVVPRRLTLEYMARLRRFGITATTMVVSLQDGACSAGDYVHSPDLLTRGNNIRSQSVSRQSRGRLAQIVAMLCIVALLIPATNSWLIQSTLQQEVDVAKESAAKAQSARNQLQELLQPGKEFARLRASTPLTVAVFNEVTVVVPDNTWLSRLEIDHGRVRLQGESQQAAALLALFEANDMFSDAQFSSTITRNARSERDRFAIEASVTVPVTP